MYSNMPAAPANKQLQSKLEQKSTRMMEKIESRRLTTEMRPLGSKNIRTGAFTIENTGDVIIND